MEIYERIKHLRKNLLKMTQEDFSKEIRISRSNLGSIETGRVNLTDRVISDICDNFSVNYEWLTKGIGETFTEILPEDEYSRAAAGIVSENDVLGMEIVKTYFSLDTASKAALKNFILQLAKKIKEDDEN
ncbi:MAG: helix-turn-helix transcriptional regulator [Clostridium sp.]|nr:helix-turn-helix transcriptional regulator [Clostridium sp.]